MSDMKKLVEEAGGGAVRDEMQQEEAIASASMAMEGVPPVMPGGPESGPLGDDHSTRPVVPPGMEDAYQDLKEVARTAKRNDGMDPDWWINMCKWAWDSTVPD